MPAVSYKATRLHFKWVYIDPLSMNDEFEIVTKGAKWRMTKAEFYRDFGNVVRSKSYAGKRGEYHYPKTPRRASKFRVS